MIIMCQCRLSNSNKLYHSADGFDNKGGYACVRAGGIWEISVLSAQFYCERKTALKVY